MKYSSSATKTNPDITRERQNATIDVQKMNSFLGEIMFKSTELHKKAVELRNYCTLYSKNK